MSQTSRERPLTGRSTHRLVSAGRSAVRGYGKLTSRWRPDPEFLLIGAKRGGSTSFFYDLLEHPNICPLFPRPGLLPKAESTKGIHFFDQNYFRGESWYRSYLPSTAARALLRRKVGAPVITGEASPYYLFHPAAAGRAATMVPDAKLLAVLRDPVQRTYSHWKERRRAGQEPLGLLDALAAEDDRIGDAVDRLVRDPTFYSYAHEQESYARQSEYAPALQRWLDGFGNDRLLVLASEDYYRDPQAALDRTLDFLDLPPRRIATGEIRNAAAGDDLDPGVARTLAARFAPHNHRLVQLTGERFDWQ